MAARQAGLATPKVVGKMTPMTSMGDLLGPDPILLPPDSEAEQKLLADESPATVGRRLPRRRSTTTRSSPPTRTRAPVITVAWTSCAATAGKASGRCPTRTNPTKASCGAWPLWRVPLTPSARPTSTGGVWTCSTTATRRPVRCSGSRRATLLAGRLAGQLAPAVEAANRAQALSRHFRAWRR